MGRPENQLLFLAMHSVSGVFTFLFASFHPELKSSVLCSSWVRRLRETVKEHPPLAVCIPFIFVEFQMTSKSKLFLFNRGFFFIVAVSVIGRGGSNLAG